MAILKFNVGDTKEVEFYKYNQGVKKEGEYQGQPTLQYMYGVRVNGEEMNWFATPNANEILQSNNLQVGDKVTMARVATKQYVYTRNGEILMKKEVEPPTRQEQKFIPSNSTSNQPVSMNTQNLEERVKTLELELNVIKGRLNQLSPDTALKTPNNASQEPSTEELAQSLGGEVVSVDEIPF